MEDLFLFESCTNRDFVLTRLSVSAVGFTRSRTEGRAGVLYPVIKRPNCENDNSSAAVKNGGSYTSIPTICVYGVQRDNFAYQELQ